MLETAVPKTKNAQIPSKLAEREPIPKVYVDIEAISYLKDRNPKGEK